MDKWQWLVKLALDTGGVGVCAVLMWMLLNKWAGKFLEAHIEQTKALVTQASATTALAQSVKDSQEDGREVLMAVRLLADRIEAMRGYLVRIDDQLESVKKELESVKQQPRRFE